MAAIVKSNTAQEENWQPQEAEGSDFLLLGSKGDLAFTQNNVPSMVCYRQVRFT
jgi:hypothetical protein